MRTSTPHPNFLLFRRALARLVYEAKGGALVELAIAMPIVILLALGVADFARMYFASIAVANAARAGAQYGAPFNGSTDSMTAAAQRDAGAVTLDTITTGRYCKCANDSGALCTDTCPGYGIPQVFDSARVRKTFRFIIHYPGLPDSIILVRTVVLRAG